MTDDVSLEILPKSLNKAAPPIGCQDDQQAVGGHGHPSCTTGANMPDHPPSLRQDESAGFCAISSSFRASSLHP